MTRNASNIWVGCLMAAISAILFSSKVILVKIIYHIHFPSYSAVKVLTLRYLFAAPLVVFFQIYLNQKQKEHIVKKSEMLTKRQVLFFVFIGLLGYTISSWFDFQGLAFTSASIERTILFSYPTITILLSALIFKTKIKRVQIIALVLTFLGIFIAFYDELDITSTKNFFIIGVLLICGSSLFYALYLIYSPRFINYFGPIKHANYTIFINAIFLFIFSAITDFKTLFDISTEAFLYFIVLGTFASVLPLYLVNLSINKIGSNNTALISTIGPISTIFQAHWFLNEPISSLQIIGAFFVIVGVLLISYKIQSSQQV